MGILDWLFTKHDEASGSAVDAAVIDQRIEQVLRIVNPRLKLVAGYHRKLSPAVVRAVLYCREIEAQIPPAIEVSSTAWSDSPLLRALFVGAPDIPALFSRSVAVQDFFAASIGAEEVWATLRFHVRQREVFGVAVEGDIVRHDVAQTTISFSDKKVVLPSGSERDARLEIRRRAFKFLVTEVLEQIAAADLQRKDLAEQRSMLGTRLRILKSQGSGLEAMLDENGGTRQQIEDVERQLAENERALAAFPSAGETLENVIWRIREVLTHAADYLRIRTVALRLDPFNVALPEGSGEAAVELALPTVVVQRAPEVQLVACRFPRRELIDRSSLLDEARRQLG